MCLVCYDHSEILVPGRTLSFTHDASGTKWSKEGLDLDGQSSKYDYAMGELRFPTVDRDKCPVDI